MPCIDPQAVPAGALAGYVTDPEGSDGALRQHIARCDACASEVKIMTSALARMNQRLSRFDCPDVTTIDAYVAGTLDGAARASLDAHLAGCSRCRDEVALTRQALAQDDPLLAWYGPGPAQRAVAAVRRLIAALVPPEVGEPALAVRLRGADDAMPLRTYAIEDVMITIRDADGSPATDGSRTLDGLISAASSPEIMSASLPIAALSLASASPARVAETEAEFGTFTLGPLAPGHYQVAFTLPDRVVVIEDLDL